MTKKPKKKKISLTADQKLAERNKREHIKFAQNIFKHTGFSRLSAAAGKEFTFKGVKSDFDDIFLHENVLVVVEYTSHAESYVSDHLKKKHILYAKIINNSEEFVNFLKIEFFQIATEFPTKYANHHYQVRIVYASRNTLRIETKKQVPEVIYLDYNHLRYFENVALTVKRSALFEFLDFLSIKPNVYANSILTPSTGGGAHYHGSVLPETHSHFPNGFKVVSFYVDAEALLSRVYVLRRDGWKNANVYQRMISRGKIEAIRKYLLDKNGVFVNNVIVTLPPSTKLLNDNNDTIDIAKIKHTTPGKIMLPVEFNSIGLIDGQHRIFSYHEGGIRESEMEILRKQQNLLVTGIMFPADYSNEDRVRFEARLFLDINANQTNAKSDLKQEIDLLLNPFSADSIARRVVNSLNDEHGPLNETFERYFYDKGKLKTTTIVSYGLRPLVRLDGDESFFRLWDGDKKAELSNKKNEAALSEYIKYCLQNINIFISAVKAKLPKESWAQKTTQGHGILNTTFVNGLIFCLRRLVKDNRLGDFKTYSGALDGIVSFQFSSYKSSQYNKMGEALYQRYFEKKQFSSNTLAQDVES